MSGEADTTLRQLRDEGAALSARLEVEPPTASEVAQFALRRQEVVDQLQGDPDAVTEIGRALLSEISRDGQKLLTWCEGRQREVAKHLSQKRSQKRPRAYTASAQIISQEA